MSKIQILGPAKDYIPVLQDFIGVANLPSNYGGTLPALDSDIHPYSETMADFQPLPTQTFPYINGLDTTSIDDNSNSSTTVLNDQSATVKNHTASTSEETVDLSATITAVSPPITIATTHSSNPSNSQVLPTTNVIPIKSNNTTTTTTTTTSGVSVFKIYYNVLKLKPF